MTVIDSLEFAQTGQSLHGRLPIPGLTRLRDSLADDLGEVEFVVTGGRDARRRLTLSVDVRGVLHLQCQRCMGTFDFPVQLSNTLLLVEPGAAGVEGTEADEAESVEASATLDVALLVEDELLLGLPYAPRHAEGACQPQPGAAIADDRTDAKTSAFAKLAALKRNGN